MLCATRWCMYRKTQVRPPWGVIRKYSPSPTWCRPGFFNVATATTVIRFAMIVPPCQASWLLPTGSRRHCEAATVEGGRRLRPRPSRRDATQTRDPQRARPGPQRRAADHRGQCGLNPPPPPATTPKGRSDTRHPRAVDLNRHWQRLPCIGRDARKNMKNSSRIAPGGAGLRGEEPNAAPRLRGARPGQELR